MHKRHLTKFVHLLFAPLFVRLSVMVKSIKMCSSGRRTMCGICSMRGGDKERPPTKRPLHTMALSGDRVNDTDKCVSLMWLCVAGVCQIFILKWVNYKHLRLTACWIVDKPCCASSFTTRCFKNMQRDNTKQKKKIQSRGPKSQTNTHVFDICVLAVLHAFFVSGFPSPHPTCSQQSGKTDLKELCALWMRKIDV